MPERPLKMKSWQVFGYARKHLGASALYAIFGKKNSRNVDYWCQDPLYTSRPDNSYDPIKGVKLLLEKLDDTQHCHVVRSTLAYLGSGTSSCCEFDDIDPEVVPLKETIGEEILADFRAVSALQTAIEAGHNETSIVRLKADAIAEIERTVALYLKDR